MISEEKCVSALNSIDVVFYNDKAVRESYKEFCIETSKPFSPNQTTINNDKFLRLLEEMAKVLGLKDVHWDDIKRYYYPIGLSEKLESEMILRKLQLKQAQTNSKGGVQQNTSQDAQIAVFTMLTELSKNPESLKTVLNFAEKYMPKNT